MLTDYSDDIWLLFLLLCHPSRKHRVINVALHDSEEICGVQVSGRTPQWFACCPSRNYNTLLVLRMANGTIRMDKLVKMTVAERIMRKANSVSPTVILEAEHIIVHMRKQNNPL